MALNQSRVEIYVRDLLYKEIIDETDLMIIEDSQNTKYTTVRDFTKSIIKDDDIPTKYRIYSSLKIQEMMDDLKEYLTVGVGQVQDIAKKLDDKKEDKTKVEEIRQALIAQIELKADNSVVIDALETKRDKNTKIPATDLDTSSDDKKIKLENLSIEVLDAMVGGTPIPTNRAPKGGWVTEDIADGAIVFNKLASDYNYGGHFVEGNINEFVKSGIYTLGSNVIGLPKEKENDNEVRLLTVEVTGTDIIKQKVEYINDLEYRPIYRRVSTINRLRVTDFIRVEEINSKFKASRVFLSDDFNNAGVLENCDLFKVTKEGHYLAMDSVDNLPTNNRTFEVDIRKFGDRIIYQASDIANNRCDIFQSLQYYTTGHIAVNTQWINISSYSRSKFEGKTVHLFGDGILFGLGSTDIPNKSIPAILTNKYGMRIINHALGDATAGGYDDDILAERSVVTQTTLDTMADADYAVIMVGSNDWKIAKSVIGTDLRLDDITYKGSLNLSIRTILDKNPSCKIILVSPIFRARINSGDNKNSDDYTMNDLKLHDFVDAMQDIAKYNHIPFANLYDTSCINKNNSTAYLKDGLYLNDDGQALIADKIFNAMNESY